MKKTYLQPQMDIVIVEAEKIFCESLGVKGNADDMTQLSRGGDWGDED